jgi:putative RNA 2'-phosphotransferase
VDRVKLSKRLSYHLRHAPGEIGLSLEPGGWVAVDALLAALRITRAELDDVVAWNPKQRFSFDESGARIRANQGHSVNVDLQLDPAEPPAVLYHGTGARTVDVILKEGLQKMSRHHVHLSADRDTAEKVGARHGRPHVLVVDAAAMRADGFVFFRSENGVWLVDAVPPKYLR